MVGWIPLIYWLLRRPKQTWKRKKPCMQQKIIMKDGLSKCNTSRKNGLMWRTHTQQTIKHNCGITLAWSLCFWVAGVRPPCEQLLTSRESLPWCYYMGFSDITCICVHHIKLLYLLNLQHPVPSQILRISCVVIEVRHRQIRCRQQKYNAMPFCWAMTGITYKNMQQKNEKQRITN